MNRPELEKRIQDLLEGGLDVSALDGLQQELRENPEAREIYREYVRLENALQIRSEGVDLLRVVPMDQVMERRQRRVLKYSGLAAVAILFLAAVVMTFYMIPVRPLLSFSTSPGTQFSLSRLDGKDSPPERVLEEGSRLQVQRGTVELKFASGVRGIVRGPADLTLQREDLLEMARGTGWFEVPEKAVGFMVSTPDLVVTDLGTEFGILSQPEFHDEVHVFTGKVEILNRYGLKQQQLLAAGEALAAGPAGRWKEIPLRHDPFLKELPKIAPGAERYLFRDDFQSDSSEDYTSIDYDRGDPVPGEFTIDSGNSGVLEIKASRAAQVVHRSAILGVRECFKVDWLTQVVAQQSSIAPSTSQILTDDPSMKRYSVRLRVNGGVLEIDFERGFKGSYKWFNNSPYTAPETFWVERNSKTEFTWYRGASAEERIKIAEITFDSDPGELHVGLQAYRMTARFDNLAVVESVGDPNGERD